MIIDLRKWSYGRPSLGGTVAELSVRFAMLVPRDPE
jgi:hypothetical protein